MVVTNPAYTILYSTNENYKELNDELRRFTLAKKTEKEITRFFAKQLIIPIFIHYNKDMRTWTVQSNNSLPSAIEALEGAKLILQMFRGTTKISEGDIDKEIEKAKGKKNIYPADRDNTIFYPDTPSKRLTNSVIVCKYFITLVGNTKQWKKEMEAVNKPTIDLIEMQEDQSAREFVSIELQNTINGWMLSYASSLDITKFGTSWLKQEPFLTKEEAIEFGINWVNENPDNREFYTRIDRLLEESLLEKLSA